MNYTAETVRSNDWGLTDPGLDGVSIRSDIGGWLDRISTEQLSRAAKQCAYFVQLLLQPGISHGLTLPRVGYSYNSPLSAKHWGSPFDGFASSTPAFVGPAKQ
jgi:hypothetical protein